jgi:hypothetical protein
MRENPRAMGLRERVQQAIAGPVGESERLLNDLPSADAETKLSILVSGWGRGLSAALEPPKRQRRPHQAGKPKRHRRNRLNEPT